MRWRNFYLDGFTNIHLFQGFVGDIEREWRTKIERFYDRSCLFGIYNNNNNNNR